MFRRDLSNFEQANLTLVIDESSTLFSRMFLAICEWMRIKRDANLDVGLGLISDLHEELGLAVNHVLENPLIDAGRKGKVNRSLSISLFPTYTAPRLSEFETNRYSFPSAIN